MIHVIETILKIIAGVIAGACLIGIAYCMIEECYGAIKGKK